MSALHWLRRPSILPLAPLFVLLVTVAAQAQEESKPEEPSLPTYPAAAALDEQRLPVAVTYTAEGPLITLEPIVARLGGSLEADLSGEGYFLRLEGAEIAFGPGSSFITRDKEILPLSRTPVASETLGPLVPLDFFELSYGDLLGYRFEWEGTSERLLIRQAERRELPVSLDVVHLQGVTTVVFQFPEAPRYRVIEEPGGVVVELLGATLPPAAWGRRTVTDPLVRSIELGAETLRLSLVAQATAESYTLEQPFRLVFDVHRATERRPEAAPVLVPPTPRDGIHTIVIDPGHGGNESGAIGPSGAAEKDLVLLLARTLKSRLESRLPVRVVLTRSDDVDLPLETRTSIANQNKADLFLSIHLNSSAGGGGARGAETYFLNLQASDELAARAAEAENLAGGESQGERSLQATGTDGDPLYDLQLILWDLAQSHYLAESQRLARLIQEELNGALGLRDRGVKQAPFRVLMGAAMPAVLVELGFLNDPQEEGRLLNPQYRAELVDALVRAVSRYRTLVAGRSTPAPPSDPPAATLGTREGLP